MAEINSRQDPSRREIDINTATFDELAAIPVLGEEGAQAIIAARPFHSREEVRRVAGFDQRRVRNLKNTGAQIGTGDFRSAA